MFCTFLLPRHPSNVLHLCCLTWKINYGQLCFTSETLLYNYSILTLVNRLILKIKLFLDSSELAQGQIFFFFFSFRKTVKSYDSYAQTYTHGQTHTRTHTQTEAQIPLASQPAFFPCCAWSGVLSSSAEHREMAEVPCSLVFILPFPF